MLILDKSYPIKKNVLPCVAALQANCDFDGLQVVRNHNQTNQFFSEDYARSCRHVFPVGRLLSEILSQHTIYVSSLNKHIITLLPSLQDCM